MEEADIDPKHGCCLTHCCTTHGCKYSKKDCPVVTGQSAGVFCEECGLEEQGYYGDDCFCDEYINELEASNKALKEEIAKLKNIKHTKEALEQLSKDKMQR